MNNTNKLTIAIAAFAFTSAAHAQQILFQPGQRQLGERYVEVAYASFDVSDLSRRGNAYGLAANFPVVPNRLDLQIGYGYDRISESGVRLTEGAVATSAVVYTEIRGMKPFVEASFTADHVKIKEAGAVSSDDISLYSFGIGVQIPYRRIAITPVISHTDSSENNESAYINYGLQVAAPIRGSFSGFMAYNYSDGREDAALDVSTIRLGVRYKF